MAYEVSLFRVLSAAILGFGFGAIWFLPGVFGNVWMKIHKIKPQKNPSPMWREMGLGFISSLIMSAILAVILVAWNISDVGGAIIAAIIMWLFTAAAGADFVLWGNEPEAAFVMHNLYRVVQLVLIGVVLVA